MEKATAKNIARFLNAELRVKKIRDSSLNGLQVPSRGTGAITTAGFAVDGCLSTFEKAVRRGVGLLIVHHGVKWRPRSDGASEALRTAYLHKHDLALYAAHLPLDLHEEFGNNIGLSRLLGLRNVRKFGSYHGIRLGYAGELGKTTNPGRLAAALNVNLGTTCRVLAFGKARVRSLGIVSGGGGSALCEAVRDGLDCFITGEIGLAEFNAARDAGINLIAAGHYATETLGVRSLMPIVRETFGVRTIFIDDPKAF
jgi:dinuclear metal center YbgI/SA1388 family protein